MARLIWFEDLQESLGPKKKSSKPLTISNEEKKIDGVHLNGMLIGTDLFDELITNLAE